MSTIKPIDYFPDVKNHEDITIAVNSSKSVTDTVNVNLKLYSIINVSQAMSELATCGDLLKVANAASKGYPSSVAIIEILSNYQSFVNNNEVTAFAFVEDCIRCLDYYKFAIKFVESSKYDKSLVIISKAAEKAKQMEEKANDLSEKAKQLMELALKALGEATSDQLGVMKKFNDNEKKKSDLENEAQGLKSEIESLNEQIAELKELADKAAEDAREERIFNNILKFLGVSDKNKSKGDLNSGESSNESSEKLINGDDEDLTDDPKDSPSTKVMKKQKRLKKQRKEKKDQLDKKEETKKELDDKEKNGSITEEEKATKETLKKEIDQLNQEISKLDTDISNVSSEIGNQLKEDAAKSDDKEKQYNQLKYQYQDLRRNTNAELAENLQTVKNLVEQNISLDVGIKSLQIVITSMGKVKTIFDNTRIFWGAVAKHCERLTNISQMQAFKDLIRPQKPNNVIKFENSIKKSGLSWLALAYINLQALNSITNIKKGVDNIMNNLPNRDEAKAIVKQTTDEIQKRLDLENKEIDDIKKNLNKA